MAEWTPAEITGYLWIDPDDASTITLNGTNVARINDKFGGANYAAQATASYQPLLTKYGLNGKDVLTFSTDKLTLATAIDFRSKLVCLVVRQTTAALAQMWSHSSINNQFRFDASATGMLVAGGTAIWGNSIAAASAITFGAWSVVILDGDSTAGKLYVNGTLKDTGGAQSVAAYFDQLGARATASEPLIGSIAEVLVVSNEEDRQIVEGYLHWRFGLEALLPSDHPYKLSAPGVLTYKVSSLLEQTWGDWSVVTTSISQVANIRLSAVILQRWATASLPISYLSQPGGIASTLHTGLMQRCVDMTPLRVSLVQRWGGLQLLISVLNKQYQLVKQKVNTLFNNQYSLKNSDRISFLLSQQYYITENTSIKFLSTQYLIISNAVIYPVSIDIKSSIDQYVITASVELSSFDDIQKFTPGLQVEVHGVLSESFIFIVDTYDYDESFGAYNYKVELVSPSAVLDAPFSELITGDYIGMASAICKDLAGNIPLYWNIIDWYIGEGVLSASEETPLSVIRKIVSAVGGVIQSLPDGSITIISRYPKSCNVWNEQPPVYSINYSEDVISEQYTLENAPGYNSFSIQDDSTSSTLLRVEVEEIDSNSKTIKVFVYPDVVPLVSHSGNTGTVSLNYTGYVTDSVEEEVEFVSGESSVEGPINSVNYYSWKYMDLGVITYEPTGVLYSAATGESLLDISYKTGYYSYTISTSVLENIQIIVEADI